MSESTITYSVDEARLVVPKPGGKVALANPDRMGTFHGKFYATDDKGKRTGDPLSFPSKEITWEVARNPLTVIDVEHGLLTLPAGERGRKASAGIDQAAIDAMLAEARGEVAEAQAEAEAEPVTDAQTEAK